MKSTKCPSCGLVSWSVANNCKNCGADLTQKVFTPPSPPDTTYAPSYQSSYQTRYEYPDPETTLSIVALVLGITSFVTLGLFGLGPLAGITLGIIALLRIKRDPLRYGGRGMAIAGLVLSCASLFWTVGIIAAIAIPNFIAARRAANEGSAIHNIQVISTAQSTYYGSYGKYGTLDQLASAGLVDPVLVSGEKNGYKFYVQVDASDNPLHSARYQAYAQPVKYRQTGVRTFYVDETTVVRARDNHGNLAGGGSFYPALYEDSESGPSLDDLMKGRRSR